MSTFSGLSSALSALYAQRRALDITGQNIANANTPGYSRQRAELSSIDNSRVPAMYSIGDVGPSGVEVSSVSRLHDEFLDTRSRAERGLNQYLLGQRDTYARVEQVVNEPSDTGVQSQMADLWAAWSDVANRPNDLSARNVVLQRAATVADSLSTAHGSLSSLWSSSREQLEARVNEVNTTATAVADYNRRIATDSLSGTPTNELRDARDELVRHLSELTGATGRARDDGQTDVYISGSPLVSGVSTRQLKVIGPTDMAGLVDPSDPSGNTKIPVALQWTDSTNTVPVSSGSIASSLETLNTTLPDTGDGYDNIAAQLASALNTQHALGFDLNGNAGGPLFTGTTATTLKVAITKPEELAASSVPPTTDPVTGLPVPNLSGGNADALADIANKPNGPDSVYRGFVTQIGVSAQTVNRRADIQQTVTDNAEADREAATGVSLDEEMTNMIQYQRAYEAAAKVISTIDTTLDSLINMKR
jgi:flagellar hook-associated protein 1